VNIDFEPQLYGINSKASFNEEFEYIYFFFKDKNLKNIRAYPKDYLGYLQKLGLELPKLSPHDQNQNDWWGELSEKSRVLNSKVTAVEIGLQNGLCPDSVRVVTKIEEVESILDENPRKDFFIRDPYLAAGNNSLIFSRKNFKKKFISKLLNERNLIMAPYFRRLMDVGFVFNHGEIELLWNLNSKDGKFKAGIIYREEKDFFDLIESEFGLKRNEILGIQNKIYGLYQKKGAEGIMQVDSFFYQEEGQVKYYPLVEVNYRKTFGLFINRLRLLLKDEEVGIFLNFNTSDLRPIENFNQRLDQIGDLSVIPLSPQDGRFSSFFATSDSLSNLHNLIKKTWQKLSTGEATLSPSLNLDQFIL